MTVNDSDTPKNIVKSNTYDHSVVLATVEPQVAHAHHLIASACAPNTQRAYNVSWRYFSQWCAAINVDPDRATVPIVATYLAARHDGTAIPGLAPLAPPSIVREYSAISYRLRQLSPEAWPFKQRPPKIMELIRGARRTTGRPPRRVLPLLESHIHQIARLDFWPGLFGVRNRALLLLGFLGAFRRSELCSLDTGDLRMVKGALHVTLRRSKTDQAGQGVVKAVPPMKDKAVCPVLAVKRWCIEIDDGPLFCALTHVGNVTSGRLSPASVALIVKQAVEEIGLDPRLYAGHSLRCGFVTTAALGGADLDSIMHQTGHKSVEQVRDYIRRSDPLQNNAAVGLLDRKTPLEE
jgi:site-specific recombinase XerD